MKEDQTQTPTTTPEQRATASGIPDIDLHAPTVPSMRICVLTIAGQAHGVKLEHIREVIPVESITPVPGMPAILLGVTNVRGSVVPVVDLRLMLGHHDADAVLPFIVVLRHEDYLLGALVDRSPEILTVTIDRLVPGYEEANISDAARAFLTHEIRLDAHSFALLDVAALVMEIEAEEALAEQE